jgi:hypothetical protein
MSCVRDLLSHKFTFLRDFPRPCLIWETILYYMVTKFCFLNYMIIKIGQFRISDLLACLHGYMLNNHKTIYTEPYNLWQKIFLFLPGHKSSPGRLWDRHLISGTIPWFSGQSWMSETLMYLLTKKMNYK